MSNNDSHYVCDECLNQTNSGGTCGCGGQLIRVP
jgi:hypothetical protein